MSYIPQTGFWNDVEMWNDSNNWTDSSPPVPIQGRNWKGNPLNPVPNYVQCDKTKSEKIIKDNRSTQVRRDTDTHKNFTITFKDVDQVIFDHLEQMQISVIDEGNTIKIPIFYGSPEKWVTAKRDGYIRDRQGKIQLPAMIFRRTTSDNDDDIEIFNRYVRYPVIQKNSSKNKYTQFALLTKKNVSVNEVFNITMADHMVFTYAFIIWTEYHDQMNTIIEKIKFNTKDYWGSSRGFRFRCRVEAFNHTIELNADDDRMVRTEFNLITNGYILPESYRLLDRQYPTTEKLFTPKKILMGMEIVATDYDLSNLTDNSDKWKSQHYPNLNAGDEPLPPAITWGDVNDSSALSPSAKNIVGSLSVSRTASGWTITAPSTSNITWQTVPSHPDSPGNEGWMAYDNSYLYIYSSGEWKRVPINQLA